MRVLLSLFAIVLLLPGCSIPTEEELLAKPSIYTVRDAETDFAAFKTFYISDTISLLDDTSLDTIITGNTTMSIVDAIKRNMVTRGYKPVSYNANPDLGINVVIFNNISIGKYYYPGCWASYPHYYSSFYWLYPYYHSLYYPFSISIPYNRGTLAIDLVNIQNAENSKQLLVVWSGIISGSADADPGMDIEKVTGSIDKAFHQSPYLTVNQ